MVQGVEVTIANQLSIMAKISVSERAMTECLPLITRMTRATAQMIQGLVTQMQLDFGVSGIDMVSKTMEGIELKFEL